MSTDYLIIGGGNAGCVLATRLKEYLPDASITLLELGPNEHDNPAIQAPLGTFALMGSPLEYNYYSQPQKHCHGRRIANAGGKQLSGSTAVNMGLWTRGSRLDYDHWAELVGDKRWNYEGFLPWFKKLETYHDAKTANPEQHGFDGPVHTQVATSRPYPLKEKLTEAMKIGTGLDLIADNNGGDPIGIAPYSENWRDGKRQPAGAVYGLAGVDVQTNTPVKRILLDGNVAMGAELADGRIISAGKEVILCAGAIRSPQLLMLSGIGPSDELSKFSIKQLVASPEVGRSLHDHITVPMFHRIRDPSANVAVGSPGFFSNPSYLTGLPGDVLITANVPAEILLPALQKDRNDQSAEGRALLHPKRGPIELLPLYAPADTPCFADDTPYGDLPQDGSVLTTGVLLLLPTSRGTLGLTSTDALADPAFDPNYFATEADRAMLRHGMRMAMRAMESAPGREITDGEFTPKGESVALSSHSADEEIDERVRRTMKTWFHPAGTCAMGKVVDADLRVKGVQRLRVVDASVFPCPLGAHYQNCVYALGEKAAALIAGRH